MKLIQGRKTMLIRFNRDEDLNTLPEALRVLLAAEGHWVTPHMVSLPGHYRTALRALINRRGLPKKEGR